MTIQFRNISFGKSGLSLKNYPVLIIFRENIDGIAFSFEKTPFLSDHGYDLRFTDAGKKIGLNYEIEKWDPGDAAYVWVQVPEIPPDGSGCIWAFWGSDDTQLPCTTNGAVWSEGYVGVWHLNESGGTHADATVENNDGVIRNNVKQDAKGLVGGANRFPGGRDDRVEVDGTAYSFEFADKSYAISAWIKPDTLGGQVAIVDNYYNSRELKRLYPNFPNT